MRAATPERDMRTRTLARWRHYVTTDGGYTGLRRFHARHRLLLLAHDPEAYRALSGLVDPSPTSNLPDTHVAYGRRLSQALAQRVSRARHLNVLEHAARSILDELSEEERRAWTAVLRGYRRADVSLSVPLDLLRGMLHRVAPRSWVARQAYLDPGPSSCPGRRAAVPVSIE